MTPLPLVVIGAGSIGMRHVEVAVASPLVDLVAVVEPDADRRARLTAMGLRAVASTGDAPAGTRAAVIATPTQLHAVHGNEALERGWATILEKPLAGTLDDADWLLATAARTGVPLFTGHHRRCHPFSIAAAGRLSRIGELVSLHGTWSLRKNDGYYDVPWRKQPGAGPLLTNFTHEADLVAFLTGSAATEVTALSSGAARGGPLEDTAAIALRHGSGVLGTYIVSDAGASPWNFEAATGENPAIAASRQDYLHFVGTRGAMSFPSLDLWLCDEPGEVEWGKPLTRHPGPDFTLVDPLLAQVERFARAVAGAEDKVLCTAAQGRAAIATTLAAALSAEAGRAVRPDEVPGDYPGFTQS